MAFYSRLKDWFRDFGATPTDLYLAQACDVHDLEHRLQAVDRGEAPFQRHNWSYRF